MRISRQRLTAAREPVVERVKRLLKPVPASEGEHRTVLATAVTAA